MLDSCVKVRLAVGVCVRSLKVAVVVEVRVGNDVRVGMGVGER
jgi:hypothetical protein